MKPCPPPRPRRHKPLSDLSDNTHRSSKRNPCATGAAAPGFAAANFEAGVEPTIDEDILFLGPHSPRGLPTRIHLRVFETHRGASIVLLSESAHNRGLPLSKVEQGIPLQDQHSVLSTMVGLPAVVAQEYCRRSIWDGFLVLVEMPRRSISGRSTNRSGNSSGDSAAMSHEQGSSDSSADARAPAAAAAAAGEPAAAGTADGSRFKLRFAVMDSERDSDWERLPETLSGEEVEKLIRAAPLT